MEGLRLELVRGQPSVARGQLSVGVARSRAGGTQRGRGDGGGSVPAPAVTRELPGWVEAAAFPAPCERADIWCCPRAGAGLPAGHEERCRRSLPSSLPAPASPDRGDLPASCPPNVGCQIVPNPFVCDPGHRPPECKPVWLSQLPPGDFVATSPSSA